MKTKLIEATNDQNHGKFLLGRFNDEEWARRSRVDEEYAAKTGEPDLGISLLGRCGWQRNGYLLVTDLQTGEGAIFRLSGHPKYDLEKHRIWVCPMYEFFLEWLFEEYKKDPKKVMGLDLPEVVQLDTKHFELYGHRRPGPASQPCPHCGKSA